jgi:hypothetical protein
MSFRNPTQISLGMQGVFFSKTYRVIGRAVLGTFDHGVLYFWHEFYLETSGGFLATLVFEVTETGPVWRWFTLFNPREPLNAADASTKRVGETVRIDNDRFRISRVSRSRIHFTEGRTPEGVTVGQTADYFNASLGSQLLVVSWTGDEVEFYEGSNVPASMVAIGFDFGPIHRAAFTLLSGRSLWDWRVAAAGSLVVGMAALLAFVIWRSDQPRPGFTPAPKPALHAGWTGTLNGVPYRISDLSLEEIDQVGQRTLRGEYDLFSQTDGSTAELIEQNQDWWLASPILPQDPWSPIRAGDAQCGQTILIAGQTAQITALFRDTILEGSEAPWPGEKTIYGFTAQSSSNKYAVEWDSAKILYQKLTPLSDQAIRTAFKITR